MTEMSPTTFRVAPMGAAALVWTLGSIAALLFFGVRVALTLIGGRAPDNYDLAVFVLLALLVVYGWLRSVKGYRLGDGELTIERAGPGKIHIPFENIARMETNPNLGSFFNMSILSIGGLFGWASKARVRNPSDVKSLEVEVYGTNVANSVVLHLRNDRTIIITPADPAAFVTAGRAART